jgi:hypothetical protein
VYIQKFKEPQATTLRCGCPYNLGDICRHEAAALFQLQEMIDRGHLQSESVKYDQRHTVVKMKTIDHKSLRLFSSQEIYSDAEIFYVPIKPVIEHAENETVKAAVKLNGQVYKVFFVKTKKEILIPVAITMMKTSALPAQSNCFLQLAQCTWGQLF